MAESWVCRLSNSAQLVSPFRVFVCVPKLVGDACQQWQLGHAQCLCFCSLTKQTAAARSSAQVLDVLPASVRPLTLFMDILCQSVTVMACSLFVHALITEAGDGQFMTDTSSCLQPGPKHHPCHCQSLCVLKRNCFNNHLTLPVQLRIILIICIPHCATSLYTILIYILITVMQSVCFHHLTDTACVFDIYCDTVRYWF